MSLLTNLQRHWKLNDDGTWANAHGAADSLTENGTIGAATGLVYATAADFTTGTTDTDYLSTTSAIGGGDNPCTVTVWARPGSTTNNQQLLFARNSGNNSWNIILNGSSEAGYTNVKIQIVDVGGGTVEAFSTAGLSANTWYRIAFRFDPSANTLTLTLNGTHETPVSSGALFPRSGVNDFRIGRHQMVARVGPVDYWDRVLSDGELDEHYNGGSGLTYENYGGGGGQDTPELRNLPRRAMAQLLVR